MKTKAQIRAEFKRRRDSLLPNEVRQASTIIRHFLLRHPRWQEAHTILTYVSMGNEVDTRRLINEALAQGKRVIVPVVQGPGILLSELHDAGDLAPGPFGIPQPATSFLIPADPSEIELAVVPGLAFDRQGHRVGFGGGYFDKLLGRMPRATLVGLAFANQLSLNALPTAPHDIRMHGVITNREVIDTSSQVSS